MKKSLIALLSLSLAQCFAYAGKVNEESTEKPAKCYGLALADGPDLGPY